MHLSEEHLDNILVHQKNRIISFIDQGKLVYAGLMMDVVEELWEQAGYGYKLKELQKRIDSYFADHDGTTYFADQKPQYLQRLHEARQDQLAVDDARKIIYGAI